MYVIPCIVDFISLFTFFFFLGGVYLFQYIKLREIFVSSDLQLVFFLFSTLFYFSASDNSFFFIYNFFFIIHPFLFPDSFIFTVLFFLLLVTLCSAVLLLLVLPIFSFSFPYNLRLLYPLNSLHSTIFPLPFTQLYKFHAFFFFLTHIFFFLVLYPFPFQPFTYTLSSGSVH